jgi:hypothetical protein
MEGVGLRLLSGPGPHHLHDYISGRGNSIPAPLSKELGQPLEELGPGMENIVAGYILAVLVLLAGIAGLVWLTREIIEAKADMAFMEPRSKRELSWFLVGLSGFACLTAFPGSWALAWYAKYLRSQTLWVCTEGLCFLWNKTTTKVIRWDQIEAVQVIVKQDYFPLKGVAKYALPMGKSRSYNISAKNGYQVSVDGNEVKRIGRFGQVLEEQREKHGFGWHVVRG